MALRYSSSQCIKTFTLIVFVSNHFQREQHICTLKNKDFAMPCYLNGFIKGEPKCCLWQKMVLQIRKTFKRKPRWFFVEPKNSSSMASL